MSRRKRNIDFHVYLDDEENEKLNSLCKRLRMDRSNVIRLLILGTRLVEAPPIDYKHFIIELRRVGTNLNQLTAKANSIGFIDRDECKNLRDDIRNLEKEIANYFKSGKVKSDQWQ